MNIYKNWEYGSLGIYNPNSNGSFANLFNYLKKNINDVEGDIVEFGVYKGHSLLSIAYFLKEQGSEKRIYGFDSFSGFPPVFSKNDYFERFHDLHKKGLISDEHYNDIIKNQTLLKNVYSKEFNLEESTTSSSGDFADTNYDTILKKIDYLELDNIVLIKGNFDETIKQSHGVNRIMAAVIDCDLYNSYLNAFEYIWPRLSKNGFIHLDEYYSLKFPGGRIATNEFLNTNQDAKLEVTTASKLEFPRSFLKKINNA